MGTAANACNTDLEKETTVKSYIRYLRNHILVFNDPVTENADLLLLSETWMENEEEVILPNFNCISHYKRDNIPAGGIAIYKNSKVTVNICTPNMVMILSNISELSSRHSSVGDICSVVCKIGNDIEVVIVAIYVYPNQNIEDITLFILRSLLEYTGGGPRSLKQNYHKLPPILSDEFNINFNDKDKFETLISFLSDSFNLSINNDPAQYTTEYCSTIDAVFSRFLDKIESLLYVCYYSYHKPIISMMEHNDEIQHFFLI